MRRELSFRRRTALLAALLAGLMGTSCASTGPKKLVSSHTAYNDAVQLTVAREVLVNIVRSRYADPVQFIAVTAVNAQFSVSAGASAGVGGVGATGTAGDLAGSVGYSDSPTITYVPQSDAAFYKSLYGPFDVGEAIGFGLSYRFARMDPGWQAMSLRFSFASINGATDFVGGQPSELYTRRIDALARLLQLGASYVQIPEWDFDTSVIPKSRVTAYARVQAFRRGAYFVEEDDGQNLRLAWQRMVVALTLPDRDDPEVIRALEDLGVTPGRSKYVLRPPTDATPGVLDAYAIWVTPRSMSDVINLASRLVDVPAAHAEFAPAFAPVAGAAWQAAPPRIRSSREEPPWPYRVQHRGYWFYVDDSEIASKLFLEAMVVAYSSRVGSKQAGDAQPQVVLPVGGG